MTASVTCSPRYASESRFSFIRTRAEISCGVYFLPSMSIDQFVPTSRLTERMVRSGLVTAWRFANSPTSTSPLRAKATMDGVVRDPSAFAMTVGSPPSRTLTQEFVVPRSMPTARAMFAPPYGSGPFEVERTGLNSAMRVPSLPPGVEPGPRRVGFPAPSRPVRVRIMTLADDVVRAYLDAADERL